MQQILARKSKLHSGINEVCHLIYCYKMVVCIKNNRKLLDNLPKGY